jgi:hypothetical protein
VEVSWSGAVHPTEEILEEYGFGRVEEPTLTCLEEHLLVCTVCQTRLEELLEYAARMKAAIIRFEQDRFEQDKSEDDRDPHPAEPGRRDPAGKRSPEARDSSLTVLKSRLAISRPHGNHAVRGLAVVVVVLAGITMAWQRSPAPAPVTVHLAAFRGGDNGDTAFPQARVDQPLDLAVDAKSVPFSKAYRLEVATESGRILWTGDTAIQGTELSAHVSIRPRPGVYWVRLYNASGELLREFGMRLI